MIYNVLEMKWTDFESMNMDKAVVFLGFAPIEEHGRHLPLGVDVYETKYWMKSVINELDVEFNDYVFLEVPVFTYGNAKMKGFRGNIHLSQKLFYDLVYETLCNVVDWGVKNIVIISGHADPKHTIAIEQACERIKNETGVIPFAPMGAILSGITTSDADKEDPEVLYKMQHYRNDYHAGWIETSNMLDINEDLVSKIYLEQPGIDIEDKDMINPDIVSKKIQGYGHIGFPGEASKEIGKKLNKSVINTIKHCITAYLNRDNYEQFAHHRLYRIPSLRVEEK